MEIRVTDNKHRFELWYNRGNWLVLSWFRHSSYPSKCN